VQMEVRVAAESVAAVCFEVVTAKDALEEVEAMVQRSDAAGAVAEEVQMEAAEAAEAATAAN